MATSRQHQSIPLYTALMEEIKVRLAAITTVTGANLRVPGKITQEFCLLQIRMVCELIALACLVAHGDISKSNKLTKYYQADRIISELEQLYPEFFPIPVTKTQTVNPKGWHLEPVASGFLAKKEFLKLYNQRCGTALHRGSLKNLISANPQAPVPFDEITTWVNKIIRLLDNHRIALLGGNAFYLCVMDENGKVKTVLAEAPKA